MPTRFAGTVPSGGLAVGVYGMLEAHAGTHYGEGRWVVQWWACSTRPRASQGGQSRAAVRSARSALQSPEPRCPETLDVAQHLAELGHGGFEPVGQRDLRHEPEIARRPRDVGLRMPYVALAGRLVHRRDVRAQKRLDALE